MRDREQVDCPARLRDMNGTPISHGRHHKIDYPLQPDMVVEGSGEQALYFGEEVQTPLSRLGRRAAAIRRIALVQVLLPVRGIMSSPVGSTLSQPDDIASVLGQPVMVSAR